MTVSRWTQHHRAPVGAVGPQRAQRRRLRVQPLPSADVRVPLPQQPGDVALVVIRSVGRRVVGAAVLLVPIGYVELLQRRLNTQLVLAQRHVGLACLLKFILWWLQGKREKKV